MQRWVYRRPYLRVAKPKIPLHRGQAPFAALRRLRAVRQRRHILARRAVVVLGLQVNNLTMAPVRRYPVQFKPPSKPKFHRALIAPAEPFVGKQGPILVKLLKAVQRIRLRFQARMRWKPFEEIPPIVVPQDFVHAIPRGSVFTAGAVEAAIYTAGAKRGRIGGDHG